MCRRNQLLGFIVLALGLGLLIGHCLTSALLCNACGIALIFLGFCIIRQK